MRNDFDADLRRLFAEMDEPGKGEVFTGLVSRRVALRRRTRLAGRLLLAGLGVAVLAFLTPWLTGLTGYLTLGWNFLANFILALGLSPAGWAIGGSVGLLIFNRARS